jgi:hypothetical protein
MSKIKELEELLRSSVLPEVEEEIDAISKLLDKDKNNKNLLFELEYMKDVKVFYSEALAQIDKNAMSEDEANNILLDLEDMEYENEDDF